MTSNVGADILQKDTSMGFGMEVNADSEYEKIRDKILDETKRIFKPEFLNRLNDLVIFRSLRMEDMSAIVDLELRNLSNRLEGQELFFDLDDAAKEFIISKGYDEKFGARPLKRAIERFLEDSLAEAILEGTIKRGEKIDVSLNDAKDGLTFNQDSLASKASH
jgi:ATP-dependent Clp protease ATP-binding subunit ClpC